MISFIYRFLRWPCVTAIIIFIVVALGSSSVSGAEDIKKVKRLVARLQLDLSQVKEQFSKSAGKELALLEPLNAKLERLEETNRVLTEKINSLKLDISLLDENLQKYKSKSKSAQLSELYQLATVFALYSVGDTSSIEPLVLELVNTGNNVQKDLLLLLLAETQKKQGFLEQGLGYYGALISDYPDSIYLNRAVFEASELLGKLGHSEEQMSMLQALKDSDGTYGDLARKRLE
jgi:lipid II:glycine glycyltransferase (peptidoglycan interpeptide bridge formation enzyme)